MNKLNTIINQYPEYNSFRKELLINIEDISIEKKHFDKLFKDKRVKEYALLMLLESKVNINKDFDYIGSFYRNLQNNNENTLMESEVLGLNETIKLECDHSEANGLLLINVLCHYAKIKSNQWNQKISYSFIQYIYYLFYYFIHFFLKKRVKKYNYKYFNNTNKVNINKDYIVFSKDESKDLLKRCKKENVSLMAKILFHSNKILTQELIYNKETNWLFPINYHPTLNRDNFLSNNFSLSFLNLKEIDDITKYDSMMKNSVKKMNWIRLMIEMILTNFITKFKKDFIKQLKQKDETTFGSISFLGYYKTNYPNLKLIGYSPTNSFLLNTIVFGVKDKEIFICLNTKNTILKDNQHINKIVKQIKQDLLNA